MKTNEIPLYLYAIENPWGIRILGMFGFASTLLLVYGLLQYFNLSVWYWVFFAPITFFFLVNRLTRYGLQSFFPAFDKKRHVAMVETHQRLQPHELPSVDVFLPYCGEDVNTFRRVVIAAINLNYQDKTIYILDDFGSGEVQDIAYSLGVEYRARHNRGEFRKAGNLQFGYDQSHSPFVLVLDADFIVHPDALHHMLPYMYRDEKIGILQTPQYFEQTEELHKKSPIQFGGGNVVEDFYRIDMPSRDRFNAAICVGTSALYRRKAILSAGGTPKVWGTEDVRQGLKITRVGYYVKYLPVIISYGESPDTIQGYFRQHNRWCTGSIATIFSEYYLKARLGIVARVSYITNATYYIAEASSVVFCFHLLTLLAFHSETLSIWNTLWFLPYLFFYHILTPQLRIVKPRLGTYLAAFSNIFTYAYTLSTMFFRSVLPWQPAGVKDGIVTKPFLHTVIFSAALTTTYLLLFISILVSNPSIFINYNAYPTLIWALYTAYWYYKYSINGYAFIKSKGTL